MSAPTRGLRRRITLASLLLGLCLSVLFGAVVVFIAETYEHILVEEILRGQAEDYSLRLSAHPDATLPRSHRLSGYLRPPGGSGDVPPDIAGLPPGIHEIGPDHDAGMHVGVFDTEHGRFFFVIDLSDIERLERLLAIALIAVIAGGTMLAAWFGLVTGSAIIEPVSRLAREVDALPVRPRTTQFAATVGGDELGRLARAIDRYQQRLVEADDAERAFFADASHELRTPVAVVRGALELLSEDAGDAGSRRRVQRLERGVQELGDLIDLLFGLVRRREPEEARGDAAALLREAAGALPHVRLDLAADGAPPLPAREAALLARGILRRLVPPDAAGVLRLRAGRDAVDFDFLRDDARPDEPLEAAHARSDRGMGLTLAGRLAARLGWRIEERGDGVRLWLGQPPTC